jgi:hypothetical protein
MIPRMDQVAFGAAGSLGAGVVPHLTLPYALGTAAGAAALLVFMAQDMDRGAERRVREIAGMKELLARAPEVGDLPDSLRGRLCAAAASLPPASVSLSALDDHRAPLLALLIELHAAVEDSPGSAARALERSILEHLLATAEARALAIPPVPQG